MKRKDYLNILILIFIFLLIVIFLKRNGYLYGSTTDWLNQHVRISEYFRTLFYDTKQLIPNFSFNLSGGVNIFTLSYYGLLNPIILISYMLPMVSMVDYIQISTIIIIILSIILFYIWMKKHHNSNLSFLSTFIFLCATPIIFHSHKHIMFINYMPFMITALMGVERYFDKKKSGLLIISIFLIIMISYFYSVGCILGIIIYGIYYYLKNNKVTLKVFMKEAFKFSLRILAGVLMASILLLPTAYVILNGRVKTNVNIELLSLIIPRVKPKLILYDSYSMGLTSIFIISIILSFIKRKKERIFLGIFFAIIVLFPIVTYLLNGGMYLNGKALIPLVPLAVYMISISLDDIYNKDFDLRKLLIGILIVATLFILFKIQLFFLVDIFIMTLCIVKINRKYFLPICIMAICLGVTLVGNFKDELVSKDYLNRNSEVVYPYDSIKYDGYRIIRNLDNLTSINKLYDIEQYKTSGYSSTLNKNYWKFYFDTFDNEQPYRNFLMIGKSQSVLFNMFMGSKYLVGKTTMPGYEKIADNLYRSDYVLPIGYASSNLMSLDDFNKLKYPDTMEALLKNIIIDEDTSTEFVSNFNDITFDYEVKKKENLDIKKSNNKYIIDAKEDNLLTLKIDNDLDNKIVVISFEIENDQSCNITDLAIDINGIKNTLTCKEWRYYNNNKTFNYVLSGNKLKIKFNKGNYVIKNFKTYTLDFDKIKDINEMVDPFNIDVDKTKGDNIAGTINVKEDGYFTISIPYDKGFNIYVDDEKIDYEMVNTAFIGFKINKGNHDILIKYESPYLKEGKLLSFIGLILLVSILCYERKVK